jgi:hypothetical protein
MRRNVAVESNREALGEMPQMSPGIEDEGGEDLMIDGQVIPARRKQFSMFDTSTEVEFVDPDFHKKWFPYWRIDRGNRVKGLLARGFMFVNKDEIVDGGVDITPENNEAGTRVRRYAGVSEKGDPEYYYLMKQPMQYHLEDEANREQYHSNIDGSIRGGTANRVANDGRYTHADNLPGSKIPKISTSTKFLKG